MKEKSAKTEFRRFVEQQEKRVLKLKKTEEIKKTQKSSAFVGASKKRKELEAEREAAREAAADLAVQRKKRTEEAQRKRKKERHARTYGKQSKTKKGQPKLDASIQLMTKSGFGSADNS